MTRRYLTAAAALASAAVTVVPRASHAQNETLFHGGSTSLGYYAAPVVKLTDVSGRGEVLAGARAGLIMGRRLAIGLAMYHGGDGGRGPRGMPIPLDEGPGFPPGDIRLGDRRSGIGYGGVEVEYVILPSRLVHASISTLIGAGSNGDGHRGFLMPMDGRGGDGYGRGGRDMVFVAEPMGNAEVNLAKHVRLTLGLGYRFSASGNLPSIAGATGALGLKLGKM